jgi:hypothetical protein
MTEAGDRLARLRGRLPAEEPGARGLERVARNPACQRLRALTMVGVTPATAVSEAYGDPPREGQSPFALAAGNRFERYLFENGAARLLDLYRTNGRLTSDECKVAIVPDLAPGTRPQDMARRHAVTDRFFRMKLARDPNAPNLIVKPRLPIWLVGVEHATEPDVLVATDAEQFYRPAEIKSYTDRNGKTDAADIRSACRQAGVGVVGMRQAAAALGVRDPEEIIPAVCDLVLRRPGSFIATLRPMAILAEVGSIVRVFGEAPRSLDELEAMLAQIAPGATLDDPAVLDAIPNNFVEGCREHCALAARCKQAAIANSDLMLLGSQAREELAAAGSLSRAIDLLHDRGGPPRMPEEQALKGWLQEAFGEYAQAVAYGQ